MRTRSISPRASRSNRTLTVGEVAKESLNPENLPEGMDLGLIAGATFSCKEQNFPNGCDICELEIDAETGEVEILGYSVVDDVGTVLNPLLLERQICDGIAQGVGQVLLEDIRFDPASGQLLTGSFMDYAMPRADDLSAIHCDSNRVPTKTNPLGVKGAGEAGNVGALPAVANALTDALSPSASATSKCPPPGAGLARYSPIADRAGAVQMNAGGQPCFRHVKLHAQ
jgi:aerobic carbon-monoxide dehydrogenase large subunit